MNFKTIDGVLYDDCGRQVEFGPVTDLSLRWFAFWVLIGAVIWVQLWAIGVLVWKLVT